MAVENSLKPGVDLRKCAPQWGIAYPLIAECFNRRGYACVITSANDSVHGPNSLHPSGYALDFRTRHVPTLEKEPLVNAIRSCLGPQFDVVFENAGGDQEHVHIEFDVHEIAKAEDV